MCVSAPAALLNTLRTPAPNFCIITPEEGTSGCPLQGNGTSQVVLFCCLLCFFWSWNSAVDGGQRNLALLITLARSSGVSEASGGWRPGNNSSETTQQLNSSPSHLLCICILTDLTFLAFSFGPVQRAPVPSGLGG